VRFTVGIGYPNSIGEATEVIHRTLAATEGVLDDPAPWVYVSELAPSFVSLTVYFWTGSRAGDVDRPGRGAAERQP